MCADIYGRYLNMCADIYGRYLNMFVGQRNFVSGLVSDIEIR